VSQVPDHDREPFERSKTDPGPMISPGYEPNRGVRKLLAKVTRGGCEEDGLPRGWVKASSHEGKYVTWTAKDGELFTSLVEAKMYAGLSSLERMEFQYQVKP